MKKPVSIRKDIIWILAVKVAVIVAIKLIFFSNPLRPDGQAVAAHFIQEQQTQQGDSTHE